MARGGGAWRALRWVLLAAVAWGIYRVLAPELARIGRADLVRWQPEPLPLATSFGLLLVVYLMHAFLWRRIMRDLGIGTLSPGATVRVYFLASLGRYLPGRLWQLAGMAVLAQRAGLPPVRATAAAVLGQFGFLSTGLLFLAATVPDWDAALGTGDGGGAGMLLALGGGMLAVAGVALWLLVATPAGRGARDWLGRRAGPRLGERLNAAWDLADRVRAADAVVWVVGYALSWVLLGTAFVTFVAAFEPAALEAPLFVAGTVAASYLAGYLFVLAPAGLGVREAAMVVLLQRVVPAPGGALVISVLSRVWFTAAELLPLAALPFLDAGNKRNEEPEQ